MTLFTMQEILRNLDANAPMSLAEIIKEETSIYRNSDTYKWVKWSDLYYSNDNTEILDRDRNLPDGRGHKIKAMLLSNYKIPHGFYKRVADQRAGYLIAKPFSLQIGSQDAPQTVIDKYEDYLNDIFDLKFKMHLGSAALDSLAGYGWMHPRIRDGKLQFIHIPASQAVPIWTDDSKQELAAFIYTYTRQVYQVRVKRTVTWYEFWDTSGVRYFVENSDLGTGLVQVDPGGNPVGPDAVYSHLTRTIVGDGTKPPEVQTLNWERVPFIHLQSDRKGLPLLKQIKGLIDQFDLKVSDIANWVEDPPILEIKDADGQDSREVWEWMMEEWAVKVRDSGGVDFKKFDLNIDGTFKFLDQLRDHIFEFARAVDTQSERYNAAVSGTALQKMYADLDAATDTMEMFIQSSMDDMLWFIDRFLALQGFGDFFDIGVDVIFNRDTMLVETEAIANVVASQGILSRATTLANHPWVKDVGEEEALIEAEKEKAASALTQSLYPGFGQVQESGAQGNNGNQLPDAGANTDPNQGGGNG